MDHAITIRDLCWAGGGFIVIAVIVVGCLAYLNALNTDL